MNTGLGIGGIFLIAVLWFVLKPLLASIWKGLLGLFTGKKQE